jgi:hypothetical protein
VWADGTRYWTTFDDDPGGHPYQTSDHHLAVVQAVAGGQEILPNRAALVAKLEPERGPRRVWLDHGAETIAIQIAAALNTRQGRTEEQMGMADLASALDTGLARRRLTDDQVLRLAVWANVLPVRDALWALITPDNAGEMVGLWSHVVRCAPPLMSPPSLSLAGFAAWLRGDGALALIAAERALAIDPQYTLAGLLLKVLEGGVPPSAWRPLDGTERALA